MKLSSLVKIRIILFLFFSFTIQSYCNAQDNAFVKGRITDTEGNPLPIVNVSVKNTTIGTVSENDGSYTIKVPSNKKIELLFSAVGYEKHSEFITVKPGETRSLNLKLQSTITDLKTFEVRERQIISTHITRIDPKLSHLIPSAGGGIETLVKTQAGVSSSNELSSQYSVRGGNFDENLVYVNGIEIYRPMLIRSGQQEGLSFINSDLVESVSFSAGGFDACYGDKMSSVLDIKYKKPDSLAGSASISLLGATAHAEGISKNKKLSFLTGLRYKSHQYLLGTLDTKGDYKPSFLDAQGLVNYMLSSRLNIFFLGNYSRNSYLFVPERRDTKFGLATDARQFTVFFEGQEVDRNSTALGALSAEYKLSDSTFFTLTTSAFKTIEAETYDILAEYWLNQVQTDIGEDNFGQPIGEALGVGSYLEHARNTLGITVINIEHKGVHNYNYNKFSYGIKYQHEQINDYLSEWTMMDSAGYSIPIQQDNQIILYDFVKTKISLSTNRVNAFAQNTWEWEAPYFRYILTAGIRANYWDYNDEWNISPRATLLLKPQNYNQWTFRASGGVYHQPPFYKELRDFEGNLNPDIKSQVSYQVVIGSEYTFKAWNRPFKYTNEIYYKYMRNLIPYEIDDMRIRYFAFDRANGYATGLDMKINGEFVPGIESWASLSFMTAKEDIIGDSYVDTSGVTVYPGYIARPTDQRVNFSIFFQDFLPRNPSYKVSLGFYFGSRLPVGAPKTPKYLHTNRMSPYRRADIGFSKLLKSSEKSYPSGHIFHNIKSAWITAEVFNILGIKNTSSYIWIMDMQTNQRVAVPNYLTSRLFNIKLSVEF